MKQVVTLTNKPYEDMWNHLLLLKSEKNVVNLLSGKMQSSRSIIFSDEELINKKAKQISSSIAQAFEYYTAAATVSINTSPLLYYYGMLSLAKALVVANDETKFLETINKYHGLTDKPPKNYQAEEAYRADASQWALEKEFAFFKPGVFSELVNVAEGFKFPEGAIFHLGELLRSDPETQDIYERVFGHHSNTQYIYSLKEKDGLLQLCPSTLDQDEFEAKFPMILNDFDLQAEPYHEQSLLYLSKNAMLIKELPNYVGFYQPVAGGRYLIRGVPFQEYGKTKYRYIPIEIMDYVLMFILSRSVRYKQEFWQKTIQGESSGIIGLISMVISNSRFRYPNFILNHLFNEKFEYGITGRLV